MLNGLQNRVLSLPETFPARRLSPSQRGIATRAALQTGRAYAKPLLRASSKALLFSITTLHIRILRYDVESESVLKWEVQFDSAVYPVVKCLRVLITAFERQVKAIDRHLNQRACLDRIEILVPHACEVPPKVAGTAALIALVDQPGCSEAAPEETIQIRV